MSQDSNSRNQNRREFIMTGAVAASALAGFSIVKNAWGQNADPIKIGLIGCGGRGTGAVDNCISAAPNVQLVAMADLFQDHLDSSLAKLKDPKREGGPLPNIKVTKEKCFVGFDAYQKLLATDVDLVILATPPGFRPLHFEATVKAGKHVFCEKPVATDPAGIRRFMEAGKLSKQKGLAVVTGTQRRHDPAYQEWIKRIQDGEIGAIESARAFWNGGELWKYPRQPGWSDMEYQCRNWYYFCWICGDHIVEQHVHNIDVINWAMNAHPVKALGTGGRIVRTDPLFGNIYDHFVVDFEYANGVHMMSSCRQWDNADRLIAEFISGSEGRADTNGSIKLRGKAAWRYQGKQVNPYVQEHVNLIASIRKGAPINEAQNVAESTMTAIMGRESTYTGKEVTWDQMMASTLDLQPKTYAFGPLPVRPLPIPGKTTR